MTVLCEEPLCTTQHTVFSEKEELGFAPADVGEFEVRPKRTTWVSRKREVNFALF